MFSSRYLQHYLRSVYVASGIPFSVFENHVWKYGFGLFSEMSKKGLLNPFLCDVDLLETLIHGEESICCLREELDDCSIYYGLFMMEEQCIVLGPLCTNSFDRTQLQMYIKRHGITNSRDFLIPQISRERASAALSIIASLLTGRLLTPEKEEAAASDYQTQTITDYLKQSYQMDNNERWVQHFPYSIEERAWACVEAGDLDGLIQMGNNSMDGYMKGKVAESQSKQEEYSTVAAISVALRAAIRGGMNPYQAYDLGDLYLQRVEKCTSYEHYWQIYIEALIRFTIEVNKAKLRNNKSIHVKKAIDYISRHINSKLTLPDIADHVGVSPQHLSTVFSKTEGITIQRYILQERIDRAKNMLVFSDYSISQISEYLCFYSQSHFGRVFKEACGETPSMYRRINKIQGF